RLRIVVADPLAGLRVVEERDLRLRVPVADESVLVDVVLLQIPPVELAPRGRVELDPRTALLGVARAGLELAVVLRRAAGPAVSVERHAEDELRRGDAALLPEGDRIRRGVAL